MCCDLCDHYFGCDEVEQQQTLCCGRCEEQTDCYGGAIAGRHMMDEDEDFEDLDDDEDFGDYDDEDLEEEDEDEDYDDDYDEDVDEDYDDDDYDEDFDEDE